MWLEKKWSKKGYYVFLFIRRHYTDFCLAFRAHACMHSWLFLFLFFFPLKVFLGFFLLSSPRNSEIICYTIIFFFGIILFNFSDWNMLKRYFFKKKLLEYLRLARLEGTYIELIIVLIKPLHICSKWRNFKKIIISL